MGDIGDLQKSLLQSTHVYWVTFTTQVNVDRLSSTFVVHLNLFTLLRVGPRSSAGELTLSHSGGVLNPSSRSNLVFPATAGARVRHKLQPGHWEQHQDLSKSKRGPLLPRTGTRCCGRGCREAALREAPGGLKVSVSGEATSW